MKPKNALLTLMVASVFVLHQDTWNWTNKTLLFGMMPIGLAYHAGYALLCVATMFILVRSAWPKGLDSDEEGSVH